MNKSKSITPLPASLPVPFDDYEIHPCRRFQEPDDPQRFYFEVCEPHEADVWTLYGHISGQGVEAIGDFSTCQFAEEIYARITGRSYGRSGMSNHIIYSSALTASIISLRHTLAKAMVDATTACKDLENGNPRAAVGAVVPIRQALDDARALLDTIFILNKHIQGEHT